ncbi:MAG: membrane protein insertase YidC [Deltaproteobacteria bacterium]|nr:membrane protein insertase YidC [Deltaproteobacteria bacterium]
MSSDIKRVVLALALSVAIMWAWSHFFGPKPQTPSPAPTAPTAAAPAATAQGQPAAPGQTAQPAPASPSAAPAPPLAAQPGKDVVVQTPMMTAVFNDKGGSLRKVVLKKYYNDPDKKGGHYVMLDLPGNGPGTLSFALPQVDPSLPLRTMTPSQPGLDLTAGQGQLVFHGSSSGLDITRTYDFRADSYAFDLSMAVKNVSNQRVEVTPELTLSDLVRDNHGNSYAFVGVSYYKDGSFQEAPAEDLKDRVVDAGDLTWLALNIPYFTGVIAPLEQGGGPVKRSLRGEAGKGIMNGTLVDQARTLEPGQSLTLKYLVFYGPRDLDILESLGHHLSALVDFGWFDIIAKPMLAALKFFYGFVGNYGVAIILITILIKLAFWPLTRKSYRSMKQMQQLQPQMAKIREKYKGDKQRMNQEIMQLYKTYKVNPMGGCLPMVVQIPVFIAFYKVLGGSLELWHAPFMLWINDLSAPDRLPIGFHIPYVGDGLPVLTLLMGASMFIQQKMTPATMGDPTQQKMMMLMPVMFTVFFINFPSGLVLYWFVNNLISIGQQYWTNHSKG